VNLLPEEFLSVVQATEVLVLSQQLNRRLRAVRVQLRHVEIVHEDNNPLPGRSAWQRSSQLQLLVTFRVSRRRRVSE